MDNRSLAIDAEQYVPYDRTSSAHGGGQHITPIIDSGLDLSTDIENQCSTAESLYRYFVDKRTALHDSTAPDDSVGAGVEAGDNSKPYADDGRAQLYLRRHFQWTHPGYVLLGKELDDLQETMESFLESARILQALSARHSESVHDMMTYEASNVHKTNGERTNIMPEKYDSPFTNGPSLAAQLSRQEETLPAGVKLADPVNILQSLTALDFSHEKSSEGMEAADTLSTCSTRPAAVDKREEPILLRKLHKNIGRLSIQQERFANLFLNQEELMVDRNFRRDQGQDVQPSDEVVERRFQRRSHKIMAKIDMLTARVQDLERRCLEADLPVTPWRGQQHLDLEQEALQDETSTSSISANSRPPSPGVTHRVAGWMEAIDLQ